MEHVSPSGLVDQVFLRCVEDCFEPIMITDLRGRLKYVNPAWVTTYGYSKGEAVGETPRLLRSGDHAEDFYNAMWETILDPKVGFWRGEIHNRAKDGHIVPVLLTITPYRQSTGEIAGYMGIAVDLTDRKLMEQQILRQDRMASIGLLAGGLAHEIGNPLGVIRGRAELARNKVKGNESAVRDLEIVVAQIDRISNLIRSLLRVSQIPERVLLREVDLRLAVDEVFLLMQQACRSVGVELKQNLTERKILAEPSHLQQLLLNIVINALHAIEEKKAKDPSSSGPDFIEISAETKEAGRCLVSIRDTGCGIEAENVPKLFQPFFTTKPTGKGTGLGLAIASRLIEEMNGTASVASQGPGKGTVFSLEFNTP